MENKHDMGKKLVHVKKFAIRWGDMDAYGHVNNTKYFLYTQEARFEMLTENNIKIDPLGISPILAETSCKFIRPIVFPETLIIETYLVKLEGKKTFFEHVVKSEKDADIVYAISSATVIWFDFVTKSAVDTPEWINYAHPNNINVE
jgi:acyl-CoA thioester hydrolase